ncbi:MAG: FAD-binding oxidoreductase [SAR324 cluster bacterium]|nr:FAD-binding oxidoreductase [SAR324 cluster bacterium]
MGLFKPYSNESVESWYQHTKTHVKQYPKFYGEKNYDAVVLGGGNTGLTSAIHLAQAGFKVALLEQNQIGWGASGRSGGQFITGFSCSLSKMINLVGKDNAKKLFYLSVEANLLLESLIKQHNIDCNFVKGYYHAAVKKSHLKDFAETLNIQKDFGYDNGSYIIKKDKVNHHIATNQYIGLLNDPDSGHIHPLNLVLGLSHIAEKLKVDIYENSQVTAFSMDKKKVLLKVNGGEVKAKYFILAGNAYLKGLSPKIENRTMPVGTYIATTQQLSPKLAKSLIPDNSAVADSNFVLDYFRRTHDNRMLYGGRVSYSLVAPSNIKQSIYHRMVKTFPQLAGKQIDFSWGGYVSITMNRAPYFGRIGNNVFFATGFSGHGVSLTLLAGKLIAEAIKGSEERFSLFEHIPHLPFPGGRLLRMPALVLGMSYYRLMDWLDR